jgi:aspartokinase/homoserine dehydrogenase 1
MSSLAWQVFKFGGTCLADAARIAHAADLTTDSITGGRATNERVAVVVSAMGGITDQLIRATELASDPDADYKEVVHALRDRNISTAEELLAAGASPVVAAIEKDVSDIEDLLRGVRIAGVCPDTTTELVSGYGELWSAQMLHGLLARRGESVDWIDAREVLVVGHDETGPAVRWEATHALLKRRLDQSDATHLVITGYVARDPNGIPTTLRRNGSDFSASIFGRLLGARSITIWTDVDGVMSADPRLVPEASVLPSLSYSEAMELAYFGAEILHPQTMAPAIESGIPILIKNAASPGLPGTQISNLAEERPTRRAKPRSAVKGFSSVSDVALLNLEGAGMIGVPGVASRMFFALREVGVSVIMISQASSEHSVCAAIPGDQAESARRAVERAFASELQHGQVQRVDLSGPYSILAAVGDNMVQTQGVAGRFFGALGRAGINVRAIAQGASERNISTVVDQEDAARALRAVHARFYLSGHTLSVGIVGPGQVGAELLRQFEARAGALQSKFRIDLKVRAVANSRRMFLSDQGVDASSLAEKLGDGDAKPGEGEAVDLDAFTRHVQADHIPHAVIIDCSASATVAERYIGWLERGIHVITPNKKANTAAFSVYERLRELGGRASTNYLYEATVGAGLPVINTLRDLLETGDRIHRIEGVLSGSLSFLLSAFGPECTFSAAVQEARALGYTEPHPRDDLSGMDVARKAVILGREIGLPLELDEISVSSLVPDDLSDVEDPDEFVAGLTSADAKMEALRLEADASGEVLRYVAVIEASGDVDVGLRRVAKDSAMARIQGGDNIIIFTTDRYADQPLIVQGPGAGPAVTAAGVFSDLLRLASSLGAPQ